MPSGPTLALLLAQILWGVHYLSSKILVTFFPPLLWASLRSATTAVLLIATALVLRRPRPKLDGKFLLTTLGLSVLGTVLNQVGFLMGMQYTTPANSAVLCTMIPVFTLALAVTFGGEKLTRRRALSLGCGLLGVLILIRAERLNFSATTVIGDVLTILNCLSYSLYLFLGVRFLQRHDRIWATAWMFTLGAPLIALASIPDWLNYSFGPIPDVVMGHAIFAVIGGTFLTYLLANVALARTDAARVALFVYLQPVVAAISAWVAIGEPITARTWIGAVFIFVGVFLARSRYRARLSPATL